MNTLTSIAVGGPLDGRILSGEGMAMKGYVPVDMDVMMSSPPDRFSMPAQVQGAYYRRMKVRWVGSDRIERGYDYWAHESICTEDDLIDRLLRGYRGMSSVTETPAK